jgi:hypothetical protein
MVSHMNTFSIRRSIFSIAMLALAMASSAAAQQFPFSLQYTQGPITNTLPNNSVLTMAAPLGQAQTLQIRATYQGDGTATISQQPAITGSSAFTVTTNQTLPLTLARGEILFFTLRFSPLTPSADTARLTIGFAETPTTTITPITLSLQGVTAAIVPSYVTPEDNNIVPLTPGATIPFPATLVGQSTPIALKFTNIGSFTGQVTSVSVTGAAFRLQDAPLFPASLSAGESLQVRVVYRPTALGPATGTVTFQTSGADPVTVSLQGTGVAPLLTYQFGSTALTPGETFTVPSVDVGQTSSTVVRIANTGNAPATISEIAANGAGFSVSNASVLPKILAPGASITFNLNFAPTRTGAHTATLQVNSEIFNLTGSGLGTVLTLSYIVGGTTVTLGPSNNAVIFSPVRISESAQIVLDVKNNGTTPATLQNIGIGSTNSPFSILNPPALPAVILPNASLKLTLKFEPVAIGFANGTLILDNITVPLTGSGSAPPALPAYTLSGPSGSTAPLTQPSVGLKLAAPYPAALVGTLTLAPASGNLPADPSVQFATGGRTVSFRIPANATDAIFGAQGTQVGLQTGTVAGAITITPSFATQAGNVDLTPVPPVSSQFTVSAAAPTLLSIQVVNPSASGFTVQVTGFSTTRTLTALNVQFTTASGFEMPTSKFTIDLKSIAAAWFQNASSLTFGGQFRVSIPFSFQLPAGQSVLSGITSVAVTAANETGTSSALTARAQ